MTSLESPRCPHLYIPAILIVEIAKDAWYLFLSKRCIPKPWEIPEEQSDHGRLTHPALPASSHIPLIRASPPRPLSVSCSMVSTSLLPSVSSETLPPSLLGLPETAGRKWTTLSLCRMYTQSLTRLQFAHEEQTSAVDMVSVDGTSRRAELWPQEKSMLFLVYLVVWFDESCENEVLWAECVLLETLLRDLNVSIRGRID